MLSTKIRRAQRALDKQIAALSSLPTPPPPSRGWLRAVREALGMTGQQFARRLEVAWQSMDDLERSEARGTITLNSLRKAASAVDCRVVYVLVPNAPSFEALVDRRARAIALAALADVGRTMLLEDQTAPRETLEQRVEDYIDENLRDSDLWASDA